MTVSHGQEGGLSLHALRLRQLAATNICAGHWSSESTRCDPRGYNRKIHICTGQHGGVLGFKINLLEFHDFLHSFAVKKKKKIRCQQWQSKSDGSLTSDSSAILTGYLFGHHMLTASQVIPSPLYGAQVVCFYYIQWSGEVQSLFNQYTKSVATAKQCQCCVLWLNHFISLSRFI